MTDYNEQRRHFDEAPVDRRPTPDSGMQWGLPLGIAATVVVIGSIFYNVQHQPTTTAHNNAPGTAQSTSSVPAAQSTPSSNTGNAAQPAKTQ